MFALTSLVALLAASATASPIAPRQEETPAFSARVPGGGGQYPTCQTIPIRWDGGVGPFTIRIIGEIGADYSYRSWWREYNGINARQMDWAADADAGTAITFEVKDSTNTTQSVGNIRIGESSDSCCRGQPLHWKWNHGASTWNSVCNADKIYFPHLRCTYGEKFVECVDNHKPEDCTDADGGFTCPPSNALQKRQVSYLFDGCMRYGQTRCEETPNGKICVGGDAPNDPNFPCLKLPSGGSICCPKVAEEPAPEQDENTTPAKRSVAILGNGCYAYSGRQCRKTATGEECVGGNPPKNDNMECNKHEQYGIVCCPKADPTPEEA